MQWREILREQAEERRERWLEVEEAMSKLRAEQSELRQYIEDLNPLLIREGLEPVRIDDSKTTGFGAIGNRSEKVPARRPEYLDVTLASAMQSILNADPTRVLHADDLASRIYQVNSKEDLRRAKASLVSTLAQGNKDGRWERVGPNKFRAVAQAEDASEAHDAGVNGGTPELAGVH